MDTAPAGGEVPPPDLANASGPVLILGAGVNGAALARELTLNGISVWQADVRDIAYGASSRSSRLIHGGLRYLEYGDFRLVQESLRERSILREAAPQFVAPLRLYVPVASRFSGLVRSAVRFAGAARSPWLQRLVPSVLDHRERGMWLVRSGLWMYDRLVRDPEFAPSSVHPVGAVDAPRVDPERYRWLCAYTDAQMLFPERFIVALIEDARRLAVEEQCDYQLRTYCRAKLDGPRVRLESLQTGAIETIEPAIIVNATGAWGDFTLRELNVPAPRLFGGTKGSHFLTWHAGLREALGDAGVYAEARDGRLIFILPFGSGVLVGTTDERFELRPDEAIASEAELDYLLQLTNELFPDVRVQREDVELHYSGVRPLPHVDVHRTSAITRDHHVQESQAGPLKVLTLVGGKLTTCRAVAEQVALQVAGAVGRGLRRTSRGRPVPGAENFPRAVDGQAEMFAKLARETGAAMEAIRELWPLLGTRVAEVARLTARDSEHLDGTAIPLSAVRWVIEREWVLTLDDLVERRLMLLYRPGLTVACLRQLAACLVEAGRLPKDQVESTIAAARQRLLAVYGKRVQE